MTVPVPVQIPVTSSWQVVDWLDRSYSSSPAGADGLATITLPALADNERWQVTHSVVSCTSSTTTQVRHYVDSVAVANLRDGSALGNFNVGDWPQGLWIPPGRVLVTQWVGCSVGAVATLALQATILRRTS
jgi:hypothetical protein